MVRPNYQLLTILILLSIVNDSMEFEYEFLLEDERIFSDCANPPPGSQNMNGLFNNFSDSTFTMTENGVSHSGNLTTSWQIEKTDIIQGGISLQYFRRGSWVPTILNLSPKNMCQYIFDERQYIYTFWFKNVINVEEIKEKCVNTPGTVLIMKTFYFDIKLGLDATLKPGRYKIEVLLTAVDRNGVERPNKICAAILGEMIQIK
ncbi:uncharacterized protein LOC108117093 isoform X1 [Drosophila eugracilis]|uniref:uncharacterized protein LOC108117093 isoform X1 n=1 Tax=Drosophila eugracilis TaxID=29029 RepID=UPI001BD92644|nr:uncharacterized protein LOC108117093 isoform X1 [Drosophila eugracilis]